ncbi:small G protein signaling modulator 1-like [Dorcoceras hygrometricum]|uniref:Small G protein signaling modulator 1-like n=1 Tax=Dorcoceras hygrometricum TaxID=472368 RepID=A0A2Z7CCN7_9LAMI|nr:small G protein signaling modulator 1-like [Dorcoceras hygrometricum]
MAISDNDDKQQRNSEDDDTEPSVVGKSQKFTGTSRIHRKWPKNTLQPKNHPKRTSNLKKQRKLIRYHQKVVKTSNDHNSLN